MREGCPAAALALLLLFASAAAPALASSGDESWDFRLCTGGCLQTSCAPGANEVSDRSSNIKDGDLPAEQRQQQRQCSAVCAAPVDGGAAAAAAAAAPAPVPLPLRLWRWDCAADCSYICMWQLEGAAQGQRQARKYFGKWPFTRWGGMQEPASVAFSLANLAAHAAGLAHFLTRRRRLLRASGRADGSTGADAGSSGASAAEAAGGAAAAGAATAAAAYPCAWAVVAGGVLSANAWLWSAVFHGRDTRITERLDYLSADALIAFNLFFTLSRTTGLRSPAAATALGGAILLALLRHAHHMLFVLFDYGLNVKICIVAGAVQSLAWLLWAARGAPPRHRGRRPLAAFVLLVNACIALEILDFPPLWNVFDAHSLWHLATAALTPLWYRFATADLTDWAGGGEAAAAARKGQ